VCVYRYHLNCSASIQFFFYRIQFRKIDEKNDMCTLDFMR